MLFGLESTKRQCILDLVPNESKGEISPVFDRNKYDSISRQWGGLDSAGIGSQASKLGIDISPGGR